MHNSNKVYLRAIYKRKYKLGRCPVIYIIYLYIFLEKKTCTDIIFKQTYLTYLHISINPCTNCY